MKKLTAPPASRLLFLARVARDEADYHSGIIRQRLIHVACGLQHGYQKLTGRTENADPQQLTTAVVEASALIAAAIADRTDWERQA